MSLRQRLIACALSSFLIAAATPVRAHGAAQDPAASSRQRLADLQRSLNRGDIIFVVNATGVEQKGAIADLRTERDSIVLDVEGGRVVIAISEVRAIDLEVKDSLKNGALWGVAYGLAASLLLAVVSKEDEFINDFAVFSMLTVPIGAGVGAAFDATHKQRQPVYRRPAPFLPRIPGLLGGRNREHLIFRLTYGW